MILHLQAMLLILYDLHETLSCYITNSTTSIYMIHGLDWVGLTGLLISMKNIDNKHDGDANYSKAFKR